ncbi:ABC transporter permease [Chlamydiales bacterium]|nr:ABC transporter permease [Chlamydiales bacterium]
MKQRKSEWLFSLPTMLWLTFLYLVPTLIVIFFAFKVSDIYGSLEPGWTLLTFKKLFAPYYGKIILRTFWLSFLTTIISLALSIPVGYYIAQSKKSVRQFLLLLIVVPFWSSFLIRIFAWKSILHPEGIIKQTLLYLNFVSPETTLLYHSSTIVFVMVYAYLPFGILPIYAAASKFNWQLMEASLDLGSSKFHSFFKVFIPGIRQGIVTAFVMIFIPAAGAYVIPDLVGGSSSEMIGNKIVQRTLVERNLPEASALSIILAVTIMVPLLFVSLFQTKGIDYEEAKRNIE